MKGVDNEGNIQYVGITNQILIPHVGVSRCDMDHHILFSRSIPQTRRSSFSSALPPQICVAWL